MLLHYKYLVRPHEALFIGVVSLLQKKNKNQIERIKHRFTRLFPDQIHKPYEDRLSVLGLRYLEEQRNRNNVIGQTL